MWPIRDDEESNNVLARSSSIAAMCFDIYGVGKVPADNRQEKKGRSILE